MDIHVRNTWEEFLTHNPVSFKIVFEDFLKLAGWQRAGVLTKAGAQHCCVAESAAVLLLVNLSASPALHVWRIMFRQQAA